jgi:hypothetical protein
MSGKKRKKLPPRYPKPIGEMSKEELREWLMTRVQVYTHSVDHDGASLSAVNPDLLGDEEAERPAS